MSAEQPGYWERLGLGPTADEREIRRAYARRLKSLGRLDSEAFELLRRDFEAALAAAAVASEAAASADPASAAQDAPPETPASPADAEVQISPAAEERRRLAAIFEAEGEEAALTALREVLAQDLGLAGRQRLEKELAEWLAGLEQTPLALVEPLNETFGWYRRLQQVGEELTPEANQLVGLLLGWRELGSIAQLAAKDKGILSVVGDWLNGSLDYGAAEEKLRRSRQDRSHLEILIARWPGAFRFAIPAELIEWISSRLPEPRPLGPWGRFRKKLDSIDLDQPGYWPLSRAFYEVAVCFLFPFILAIAMNRDEGLALYGWLTPALPLLVEAIRFRVEDRFHHLLANWLPTALLWSLLGLAAAALAGLGTKSHFFLWWAAFLLAVLLSFEKPRSSAWQAADAVGYFVFTLCLVGQLHPPPFLYVLAPPLLAFPGSFFGRFAPRAEIARNVLRAAFAAAILMAALAPAGDETRRLGYGLAIVALLLLLRESGVRLDGLLLAPLAVYLLAKVQGAPLAEQPFLLLLFLLLPALDRLVQRRAKSETV